LQSISGAIEAIWLKKLHPRNLACRGQKTVSSSSLKSAVAWTMPPPGTEVTTPLGTMMAAKDESKN
jgi:hypothetical protein